MNLKATEISPVHEVEDQELYSTLVASMYRKGWVGRPLLAFAYEGATCALTGSHRIAAARHNDMEVPVYLVKLTAKQADACLCGFQDDRMKVMVETGDVNAIALFEQELAAGQGQHSLL